MVRHFTVTGFVSYRDRTLLHWHRKLGMWLPPGGHIEPDEDPVEAVVREVCEESGLEVDVIDVGPRLDFDYPAQLPAPVTILLEDIPEPGNPHQHIDLIYFCRPRATALALPKPASPAMVWVDRKTLELEGAWSPQESQAPALIPLDVRLLALRALDIERASGRGRS